MPREDKQREKQGTAPCVKPHACLYCTAAFGKKWMLTRHVRGVHEKQGTLSRADFEKVVRELCPVKPLSGKVQEALTKIFDAFEINDSNKVDMSSFLAGFLMLASGSKSEKLALAFQLFDEDGDGYGTTNKSCLCSASNEFDTTLGGDCNDDPNLGPLINPGALEICTTGTATPVDEDCDGDIDEDDASNVKTWYRDADDDGYGTNTIAKEQCDPPTGYVSADIDQDGILVTVQSNGILDR